MDRSNIEEPLRSAVDEEKHRNGEMHINVAFRLNDLAKYLAAQMRLVDAEPILNEAVSVVAYNTLQAGSPMPSDESLTIITNYQTLLRMLGLNRTQRMMRLNAALEWAMGVRISEENEM
jgi:hypothetical protein